MNGGRLKATDNAPKWYSNIRTSKWWNQWLLFKYNILYQHTLMCMKAIHCVGYMF